MKELAAGKLNLFVPTIKVIGVGGGGGNVIAHMIRQGIAGVTLISANTDIQALRNTRAEWAILLGHRTRKGRGAGADPVAGRHAAEESAEALRAAVADAAMVFITAGLGGGTGTGAAPQIARLARDAGALTVAAVTLPFSFEGKRRAGVARAGLKALAAEVDMVLVIPNDKLVEISTRAMTLLEAFALVDGVMVDVIQGITDLLTQVGLINVDFADVRTVLEYRGGGVIGKGTGSGEQRLLDAARGALNNPLMGNVSLRGAKGVLVHVMGNEQLGLGEVHEAMDFLAGEVGEETNLIFGATTHPRHGDTAGLMVIATGVVSPYLPSVVPGVAGG
jgi:cell division protein FtsZ